MRRDRFPLTLEKILWNTGAFAADRQRRRDARLQDRVALDNPAPIGVKAGPVQRMGHLADQATHRTARQSGVRIKRHDIANACRGSRRSETHVDESGVGRGAKQPIQFVELAALALPSDPPRFTLIPDAPPVQKEEARSAWRRAIAQIETRDAVRRSGDERSVAVGPLVRGVGPVGHQREMKIALRARKVVNLEPFDQVFDAFERGEQRWHGDERAQVRGDAIP